MIFIVSLYSKPSFNGGSGCSGGGCHSYSQNSVSLTDLGNLQVEITVNGVQSGARVAGELINSSGSVVAYINQTSSNPFTLTAPSAGNYTINAGYKTPSLSYGTASLDIGTSNSIVEINQNGAKTFKLFNNYPNPFNMETSINFEINHSANTKLSIYNIKGQKVKSLVNGNYNSGKYSIRWDGTNDSGRPLSSGEYVIELISGERRMVKKTVLLK